MHNCTSRGLIILKKVLVIKLVIIIVRTEALILVAAIIFVLAMIESISYSCNRHVCPSPLLQQSNDNNVTTTAAIATKGVGM